MKTVDPLWNSLHFTVAWQFWFSSHWKPIQYIRPSNVIRITYIEYRKNSVFIEFRHREKKITTKPPAKHVYRNFDFIFKQFRRWFKPLLTIQFWVTFTALNSCYFIIFKSNIKKSLKYKKKKIVRNVQTTVVRVTSMEIEFKKRKSLSFFAKCKNR